MKKISKAICCIVLSIVIIGAGIFLKVHLVTDRMESQSDAETINNLEFLDTDESAFNVLVNTKAELPGKDATLKSNENVVGWLNIKDVVDLPIMKNDSLFANHDYAGNVSISGCITMKENKKYDFSSSVLCIEPLAESTDILEKMQQYSDKKTALKNTTCTISRKKGKNLSYKLFSVYYEDKKNPKVITTFKNTKEFNKYVTSVYKASTFTCIKKQPNVKQLLIIRVLDKDRNLFVVFYR